MNKFIMNKVMVLSLLVFVSNLFAAGGETGRSYQNMTGKDALVYVQGLFDAYSSAGLLKQHGVENCSNNESSEQLKAILDRWLQGNQQKRDKPAGSLFIDALKQHCQSAQVKPSRAANNLSQQSNTPAKQETMAEYVLRMQKNAMKRMQEGEGTALPKVQTQQAEQEAKRKAELAANQQAEAAARERANQLAQQKTLAQQAEQVAKRKAELAANQQAEAAARVKANQLAQQKAQAQQAEQVAKRKAELAANKQAEAAARVRANQLAQQKAQAQQAEQEAKRKAELAANQQAEAAARVRANQLAQQKAQAQQAEQVAKRKAELAAKQQAEAAARERANQLAQQKAQAQQAEQVAKRKAELAAKQQADARAKEQAEQKAKAQQADLEAKRKAEAATKKQAEEEDRKKIEAVAKQLHETPLSANTLTGREILDESARRHDQKYEYEVQKMTLVDKAGNKEERTLRRFMREINDNETRYLSVFLSPSGVKGVGLLTWQHDNSADDQWLYLPANGKKMKRIAKGGKKNYFMGTDYTYEDLVSESRDKFRYEKLADESIKGSKTFVIKAIATHPSVIKETGYSYRKLWIRQDNFVVVQIDFYDKRKRRIKRQKNSNLVKIKAQTWRSNRSVMEHFKKKHKTITVITSRSFKQSSVPEKNFRARNIVNGRVLR